MPIAEAMRRCPELIRVAPRMQIYRQASQQIFDIFREFTPLVEGLSLDEAFLDVTNSRKLLGDAKTMAANIKQRILQETRLTASVGVAENKLVAKIASDLEKPDGLVVVTPADYRRVLDPLPVSVIPGIGRETLVKLHKLDLRTVAGLRVAEQQRLLAVFGRFADKMRARASGLDDRPVVPERAEKSISAEQTYDADLTDRREMEKQLLRLADRTAARLRKAGLAAATIQLKIREADFTTYTRQQSQQPATDDTLQIAATARDLLDTWIAEHPGKAIRLLGIGGCNLGEPPQPDLFAHDAGAGRTLDKALDDIRERFGSNSLAHARTLDKP
jgi:DNA polymerase-4